MNLKNDLLTDRPLGAPLSADSGRTTRVLLLGSGELGREMAIELMRLGAWVCAADSYEGAPAAQVAHECRVLDMSNAAELHELIDEVKPDIVIPEVEAIATSVLADVASASYGQTPGQPVPAGHSVQTMCKTVPLAQSRQKGQEGIATPARHGVQVSPSSGIAAMCMDREKLRVFAHETLGLPTTPYRFAGSLSELKAGAAAVGFPCVVKPIMSSSGHGQSVVRSKEELEAAWNEAQSGRRASRAGEVSRVIVEALAPLTAELTVITVSSCAGVVTCEPIGQRQEHGDYRESWQPAYRDSISHGSATTAPAVPAATTTTIATSSAASTTTATAPANDALNSAATVHKPTDDAKSIGFQASATPTSAVPTTSATPTSAVSTSSAASTSLTSSLLPTPMNPSHCEKKVTPSTLPAHAAKFGGVQASAASASASANVPDTEVLDTRVLTEARRMAKTLVEGMVRKAQTEGELGWGVYGVELFVLPDGSLLFNEVSPRPHDTGMVTMISQHLSEFALQARAVLGLPVTQEHVALALPTGAVAASHAVVVEGNGEATFSNIDEALAEPGTDLRIFSKPRVEGHRRMAVALAIGADEAQARAKAKHVATGLRISVR